MNNLFPLLTIETTDELCSAAILLSEEHFSESNVKGKYVHSEKLIPIVKQLLEVNKLKVEDLNCIAISEGPGSFTGLRIGMAAAKGLATGSGIPILPVPTFEALAHKIKDYIPQNQSFAIVRKASGDEIYFEKYKVENESLSKLESLVLLKLDELQDKTNENDLLFSNINHGFLTRNSVIISALDVGKWAYKFGKDLVTSDYDLIEPKYFKEFIVRDSK